MKMIRLNAMFAILMALVVMSGCKKDEAASGGPEGYVKPAIVENENIVEIPAAIQNSQDPNLAFPNSMLAMVNGFSVTTQYFATIPANAELKSTKSSTKIWEWTNSGFTITIEFTESIEGYKWIMYMQHAEAYPEKTKVIEATQTILGTSGQLKFYNSLDEAAVVTYTWTIDGEDVYAEILVNSGDSYVLLDVEVYEDNSGIYNIYEGSTTSSLHVFHCEWNASGHGSWWADAGEEADYTGTF